MTIYAIVNTKNYNDGNVNISVTDIDSKQYNIKMLREIGDSLNIGYVYQFDIVQKISDKRTSFSLESVHSIDKLEGTLRDKVLRAFFPHQKLTYEESKNILFTYIEKIDNKIIHDITFNLVNKYLYDLLTYPAGLRIHHAYIGGLIYHTIGMLKLGDAFLNLYSYLDKNYIYSGIILHDLGKIKEYSNPQNPEFALPGHLLGHLVIGALEVEKEANLLGYVGSEEVMLLEHILVSHHGQQQFGAAKKPITAEANIIWYIDTIDSKFEVLGEVLEKTKPGEFTESLPVMDRARIYKPKC